VAITGKATLYVAAAIAVAAGVFLVSNVFHSFHYWGSDRRVVSYLEVETPLGSSVDSVRHWLRERQLGSEYSGHVTIRPGSGYPLTKVGGSGFIHTVVATYGWPFEASLEVFYIFDNSERLCDVTIRRTVDAL
jgi:hypothetical protein